MSQTIAQEHFTSQLFLIMDEVFVTHHGVFLDRNNSLFETLAPITAAQASIPVGGKCAACKEKIAWRYPAVEILTALVFGLVTWQIGLNVYLPVALAFASTMIALVFIDADHMILPNVITYPMFVVALAVRLILPVAFGFVFSDTTYVDC